MTEHNIYGRKLPKAEVGAILMHSCIVLFWEFAQAYDIQLGTHIYHLVSFLFYFFNFFIMVLLQLRPIFAIFTTVQKKTNLKKNKK
jgi:hypothetical protein